MSTIENKEKCKSCNHELCHFFCKECHNVKCIQFVTPHYQCYDALMKTPPTPEKKCRCVYMGENEINCEYCPVHRPSTPENKECKHLTMTISPTERYCDKCGMHWPLPTTEKKGLCETIFVGLPSLGGKPFTLHRGTCNECKASTLEKKCGCGVYIHEDGKSDIGYCQKHKPSTTPSWEKLLSLAQDTCGKEPTATDKEFYDALSQLLSEEREKAYDEKYNLTAKEKKEYYDRGRADERRKIGEKVAGMRQTTIEWANTTKEEKNALLACFDGYNKAISDVLALINSKE